jgi:3-oxoacyl-[acyl-carrier protein] reductase
MSATAAKDRGCALVTGASRGIGAAIARGLAADGWPVGVAYRADDAAANVVVDEILAAGGKAVALKADIGDPAAADGLCSDLERGLERPLLVLVNNAATTGDRLSLQMDDESWEKVIDTDLSAAFRLTRRALRPMLRKRFGRVVNVASVAGHRNVGVATGGPPTVGHSSYAAAKAGLIGFTKAVAVEVARHPVTINAIAPGLVDTDLTRSTAGDRLKSLRDSIPAGRAGTPEEIAACARFLVSEQASYVNGSVLTVDGGLTA